MKTNLLKLFAEKEVIWFYRMKEMKSKMNWVSFCLALPLQFIGQHAFALMHFFLECLLFLFYRNTFKRNINVLNAKLLKSKIQYGLIDSAPSNKKYNIV